MAFEGSSTVLYLHIIIIIMYVLPKTTASAGTKIAVLPKARLPSQIQEPSLQFCPKAGLSLQNQETKAEVLPEPKFHIN